MPYSTGEQRVVIGGMPAVLVLPQRVSLVKVLL